MYCSLLLLLASLSVGICQKDDILISPNLNSGFKNLLGADEQNFLEYKGNATSTSFLDPVSGPLMRRDCASGQKACGGGCIPTDGTCCTNGKYCSNSGVCCAAGCAEAGGHCCADGHGCTSITDCCDSKCIPSGTNCCKGGDYCIKPNQCVLYSGLEKCCIDLSCIYWGGDDGITTTRSQTWTFSYTVFWYSYYYTVYDLTSTRSTYSTTFYVEAVDSYSATSSAELSTSSIRGSLTADAHTTPRTTPSPRPSATPSTAPSTTADPATTDDGTDLGAATAQPNTSGPISTAAAQSSTSVRAATNGNPIPVQGNHAAPSRGLSRGGAVVVLALWARALLF